MNDTEKIEFFDNLTASITARFRYQEMRIELAEYGEYGFVVGAKRQNERDYINDREKLTESIEKVKLDITRMQYLIDNIESCYETGISGYAMIDSFGKDLWNDLHKNKERYRGKQSER